MWAIAKVKASEIIIFKQKLTSILGKEIKFYSPKVSCQRYSNNKLKYFDKEVLENYIFCYHEKFTKDNFTTQIQFVKGLQYFLKGYIQNQQEIKKFINYCKSCENDKGYLKPIFFKTIVSQKGQFVSGPFTNMMFEIITRQKNKLKILIGNIVTTISDNENYLYRPI